MKELDLQEHWLAFKCPICKNHFLITASSFSDDNPGAKKVCCPICKRLADFTNPFYTPNEYTLKSKKPTKLRIKEL